MAFYDPFTASHHSHDGPLSFDISVIPVDPLCYDPTWEEIRRRKDPYPYPTNANAIDVVTIPVGPDHDESAARVTIINTYGYVLFDEYIAQTQIIHSTSSLFHRGQVYESVNPMPKVTMQQKVLDLLFERVMVGHRLDHTLSLLGIRHPLGLRRDLAIHYPASLFYSNRTGSLTLDELIQIKYNRTLPTEPRDPLENTRTMMRLYLEDKEEWDTDMRNAIFADPKLLDS